MKLLAVVGLVLTLGAIEARWAWVEEQSTVESTIVSADPASVWQLVGEGTCRNPGGSYTLAFGPENFKKESKCKSKCDGQSNCDAVEFEFKTGHCYGFTESGNKGFHIGRNNKDLKCWQKFKERATAYEFVGEGTCRNPGGSYTLAFGPVNFKKESKCKSKCNGQSNCDAVEFKSGHCYGFTESGNQGFHIGRNIADMKCWQKIKARPIANFKYAGAGSCRSKVPVGPRFFVELYEYLLAFGPTGEENAQNCAAHCRSSHRCKAFQWNAKAMECYGFRRYPSVHGREPQVGWVVRMFDPNKACYVRTLEKVLPE